MSDPRRHVGIGESAVTHHSSSLREAGSSSAVSLWPASPGTKGWGVGLVYLGRGLALSRRAPRLYLSITLVYTLPALLSAWLVSRDDGATAWQQAVAQGLTWITIILGTVVIMIAVGCHCHDSLGLGRASVYALSWLPRYLWTNVHTSIVFWAPLGLLLVLRGWQQELLPVAGAVQAGLNALWTIVLGATALYLHARTLLAPFLAVHADLPATLAALEAWRLSGRALVPCLSTLILASLPLVLPLLVLGMGVLLWPAAEPRRTIDAALPELVAAAIQVIRPVLIPATYWLYSDLWEAERARRQSHGSPPEPAPVRALLELTRPLPSLGRWPIAR